MNILLLDELGELEDYLTQKGHSVKKTDWISFTKEKIGQDITFKEALKDYHLIIWLSREEIEGLIRYIKKECPDISLLILLPAHTSSACDMVFSIEVKGRDGRPLIAPDFVFNLTNWQEKIEEVLNSMLQGGKKCFG